MCTEKIYVWLLHGSIEYKGVKEVNNLEKFRICIFHMQYVIWWMDLMLILHTFIILFDVSLWHLTASQVLVSIGSGKGLLPEGTKLLPELVLT